MQGVIREKRFAPIDAGKLSLVTIDVARTEYRLVNWRGIGRSVSVGAHVKIAEGQQKGRHFWITFMMSGKVGRKNCTETQLRSMLECDRRTDPTLGYTSIERMVDLIDGRTYPVEITQKQHWQTGATISFILALSLDPTHWAWESYHELVKRLGDDVPGVAAYAESQSAALIVKRLLDATKIRDDGQTLVGQGRKRSAAIRASRPQLDIVSLLETG